MYPSNSLPDPGFDTDSKSRRQAHFLQTNILKLAAFAWKGYLLKGEGAMAISGLPLHHIPYIDTYEVEVSYWSTEEILQLYPTEIELIQFIQKYDPTMGLVITFTDEDGDLQDSYHLTLTMPLSQCYVLWQEKLLEREAS